MLEGKLTNRKDTHTKIPSVHHRHQRPKADKTTKMGKKQCRKAGNSKNQSASPPPKECSLPAMEQSWMENNFDELTEVGFRRSVITNFSELKEHVLTHCKEVKHLEKRLDEWLTRINSVEKILNDLMELKTIALLPCQSITALLQQWNKVGWRMTLTS